MVLDSPALVLDPLIHLPRGPDTPLIHAHPCWYQMTVLQLIMDEHHPAILPCFFQDLRFESVLDVFEVDGAVGKVE